MSKDQKEYDQESLSVTADEVDGCCGIRGCLYWVTVFYLVSTT